MLLWLDWISSSSFLSSLQGSGGKAALDAHVTHAVAHSTYKGRIRSENVPSTGCVSYTADTITERLACSQPAYMVLHVAFIIIQNKKYIFCINSFFRIYLYFFWKIVHKFLGFELAPAFKPIESHKKNNKNLAISSFRLHFLWNRKEMNIWDTW